MTVVMCRSQQHGRRGQRTDRRHLVDREIKLVAREFDVLHSLFLLVESTASLKSC